MADEYGVLAFPDPPLLRPIGHGTWQLASTYVVPAFGFSMRIPEGFVTDLASVPHWTRSLVGTEDLGAVGAIAHDLLYQQGGYASGLVEPLRRVRVDRLFRVLMQMENVIGWRRWVAWAAVRIAGWACWKSAPRRVARLQERRQRAEAPALSAD